MMKRLLCLVIGHRKTLVAFTSNRFSCRRCGVDLGRDVPVMPTPPAPARTRPVPRGSDQSRGFPQEQSRPFPLVSSGKSRLHARPRRDVDARGDRLTRSGAPRP